jgi:uncharacterized membrane protein
MPVRRPAIRTLATWAGIAALLLVIAVLVPAVADFDVPRFRTAGAAETTTGRVIAITERTLIDTPRGALEHEVLAVEVAGETVTVTRDRAADEIGTLLLEPGDRVLVARVPGPTGDSHLIVDRVRSSALWVLALAFAALVVLAGRTIGASSLFALAAVFVVIVRFIVPGLLSGHDPVIIATTGGMVILVITLFLAHGVTVKSTVALAGTLISLLFTAFVAEVAITAARLSGVASEDAAMLQVMADARVSASGLLLAGIIIGALGVLDDVAIAQASAVYELRRANPLLGARDVYRRAMNVGRDHIAAAVSTLVLAYAGASLPLLMLLVVQGEALAVQLNREYLATEVVRALVGSIGLIAAVPLTTMLAVVVASRTASGTVEQTAHHEAAT